MIRVINSVQFDEQALRSDPEFLKKVGPGLLVTVDAEQKVDAEHRPSLLVELGSTVRIHRPDGSVIDRVVTAVEVWGQHAGLFFSNTEQHEIPISSEIELPV